MHVLGKVFLGFMAFFAIVAIVLTTMLLDVRSHWLKRVADAKQAYESVERDLAIKTSRVRSLQDEIDRVKNGWGDLFLARQGSVIDPATGTVRFDVGSQQGLGVGEKENQVVYLFHVTGPDQSTYLGAFQLQNIQAGSATARLFGRPVRSDETIPAGVWRVREEISVDYAQRLVDINTRQILAEEDLARVQYNLKRYQEQQAASEQLLRERINQLQGDPNLQNPTPLQASGYVQAIRDAITKRNQLIRELDARRRELKIKTDTLQLIAQENQARRKKALQQSSSGRKTSATASDPSAGRAN